MRKNLIDLNSPGLPNILKHIGVYNVRKFLTLMENIPILIVDNNTNNNFGENPNESMEKKFNDVISIRYTFTLMLVFECKLMTEVHEKNLNNQARGLFINNEFLTKENFMKIEFWFERDPNVNTKINEEEFKIPSSLKESLYEINKEENVINIFLEFFIFLIN